MASPSDSQRTDTATDSVSATVDLPSDADAVAIARRFVAEHSDHLGPDLVGDAQLLVSEIVTNAIRYGRPRVTLRVRVEPPTIGVAVSDAGSARPQLPSDVPDPTQTTGRGLIIVDALSDAWGVEESEQDPGKTVWFDLTDPAWHG